MKKILSTISVTLGLCFSSLASNELLSPAIGGTISIKTDFWVYEIKGTPPYSKDNYYTMNSSRGGGIGGRKYKYLTTLPKSTQFEVVSLVKKNDREWIYILKIKGDTDPQIGNETISVYSLSMLETPTANRKQSSLKTQLDPDLFTIINENEK